MSASATPSGPIAATPRRRTAVWPHILHLGAVLVVAAGLTHLASVLWLARRPDSLAFTRVQLLAAGKPGETVPLGIAELGRDADPALAATACLFDLGRGPVAVSVKTGDTAFALLAVYDRHGRVIYGLTSRSASAGTLSLEIRSASATEADGDEPAPAAGKLAAIRVTPNEPVGFVVAQALAVAPSAEPGARQVAGSLRCTAAPASP